MEINEKQENYNQPYRSEKKVTAGILAILIGTFGVHKFYLGYTKAGIIQLVLGIVTCGLVGIIGLIEGIIYLTKSDEEFDRTYVQNQKEWF
ncbi:TM2 domain-containing membrane protein YozV [Chryseobacterium ginsenosidimutans]|jgi:TM2 domain-containing membrane protein YozV|uniref:TM2 domain-containing protein n=1 Tax=Chryseobacterium ginsenosidimutans TaxID=687846 RepID=UPI00216A333C|nr:TM2 domain-containing protein [Chryseobacterium ginsenosidimutans]MCS3870054.1 TM2 domain-containing membrane protein YozV [Chryseobacterium ginsenosidimutans]